MLKIRENTQNDNIILLETTINTDIYIYIYIYVCNWENL